MKLAFRLVRVPLALLLFTLIRLVAVDDSLNAQQRRLTYLAERIEQRSWGIAPPDPFEGEWRLMTVSFSALAAANLASADSTALAQHRRWLAQWSELLASPELRAYDVAQWSSDALLTLDSDHGHAGYLGHLLLTLDAACALGATHDLALRDAVAAALDRRIAQAPDGLIETYPGERYIADTMTAVAALAEHDRCRGTTEHRSTLDRWVAVMRSRWLDPDTQVLVFSPGESSRGSAAAWGTLFLPLIDEAFAAEQADAMWKHFGDRALFGLLVGIREYRHGVERDGDVDSGPLVFGISPSGTGIALADTAWRQRPERAGLLRTAELAGVTFRGRFLLGPLVGDAATLAASTMRPWPHLTAGATSARAPAPPASSTHR